MYKGHIALSIHQVHESPYPGYYNTLHLTNACDIDQLSQLGENIKYIESLIIESTEVKAIPEYNIAFPILTHITLNTPNISHLPKWISQGEQLRALILHNTNNLCCTNAVMENNLIQSITLIDCNIYEIPSWIKQQNQLKKLIIHKSLINKIPDWITSMTNIDHIEICQSNINKISENLQLPSHIKTINLSNNKIYEIPDIIFNNHENIENINISNNPISHLPYSIKKLNRLKYINIHNTNIHNVVDILRISHAATVDLPSHFQDNQYFSMDLYKKIGKVLLFEEDKCEILSLILKNRIKDLIHSTTRSLLSGLHIRNDHIDYMIIQILQQINHSIYIPQGSHIAFLSRIPLEIQNISNNLSKDGIIVQKTPNQDTSHIVVGKNPSYLHLLNNNQTYKIITTSSFQDYYIKKYHSFWSNSVISETIEKLSNMFIHGDTYNQNTVLEILYKHGATKEAITLLSIVYLSSSGRQQHMSLQLLNKYTCFSFHERLHKMCTENMVTFEELLKLERLFPHFNASIVWESLSKKV